MNKPDPGKIPTEPAADARGRKKWEQSKAAADPSGLTSASERFRNLTQFTDTDWAVAKQREAEGLRAALEEVLDVWAPPSDEAFYRIHRAVTGHDSCNDENDHYLAPTSPASGPLTSGSTGAEGLDVERLAQAVTNIGISWPWLLDRAKGAPNEGKVLADVIRDEYARLTADASASSQEAEG